MADGAWEIRPATPQRWADFEQLMGPKGGSGGCWCMLWRQTAKEHAAAKGDPAKGAMRAVFAGGSPPGLLAYDGEDCVGWLSVAPRAAFPRLETSRILKPVDKEPVWSITCFLIAKTHRRRGLSVALLDAAGPFVAGQGGAVIEGYPIEPDRPNYPTAYAWIGLASAYRAAGFEEIARRSPTRPIMRKRVAMATPRDPSVRGAQREAPGPAAPRRPR